MCLVYHTLFADETTPTPKSDAHLYGHVIDSKTGEHLPYATVTIPGTTIGTMTDASGHYFLKNLPTGTITVEARMMSYDPVRHEVTLKKGQSLELNFEITENGITMDDVVVSASRSETTRRKAPALVNVLDRKIFDNTNSACLAQGLGFQPGVRVEDDCQNCGFMQVRINGLDGHYSQILVDSHPVFSALSGVYRTGADSGQHDRPRRGDARRRLGTLRLLGHRRYDQHHHQGPRPQQRRSRSHDHGDRQQQQLRQRHLGQCLARHRQP